MKRCCHCGIEKSLDCFGKDIHTKDGLKKTCKSCLSIAYKDYNQRHPEKAEARCKKYRNLHPDRVNELARDRYKRNPERAKVALKKYVESHKDVVSKKRKEYHKREGMREWYRCLQNAWRKTDKGRKSLLLSLQKRRKSSKNLTNDLTSTDISLLLEVQDGKCAKCRGVFSDKFRYTLDHILPVSMGGGLTRKNVQLLCKSCNSSKNARHILYRRLLPDEVT